MVESGIPIKPPAFAYIKAEDGDVYHVLMVLMREWHAVHSRLVFQHAHPGKRFIKGDGASDRSYSR
jgi:hypothetical protein